MSIGPSNKKVENKKGDHIAKVRSKYGALYNYKLFLTLQCYFLPVCRSWPRFPIGLKIKCNNHPLLIDRTWQFFSPVMQRKRRFFKWCIDHDGSKSVQKRFTKLFLSLNTQTASICIKCNSEILLFDRCKWSLIILKNTENFLNASEASVANNTDHPYFVHNSINDPKSTLQL